MKINLNSMNVYITGSYIVKCIHNVPNGTLVVTRRNEEKNFGCEPFVYQKKKKKKKKQQKPAKIHQKSYLYTGLSKNQPNKIIFFETTIPDDITKHTHAKMTNGKKYFLSQFCSAFTFVNKYCITSSQKKKKNDDIFFPTICILYSFLFLFFFRWLVAF